VEPELAYCGNDKRIVLTDDFHESRHMTPALETFTERENITNKAEQNRTERAEGVRHVEESKEVERIKERWKGGIRD
jgi:hypothetical protein